MLRTEFVIPERLKHSKAIFYCLLYITFAVFHRYLKLSSDKNTKISFELTIYVSYMKFYILSYGVFKLLFKYISFIG